MATDASVCHAQNPPATEAPAERSRPFAVWLLMTVGFALFAILLLAGYGYARFGSLYTARAYLHGERLFLDQPIKSVGELRPGQEHSFVFTLTNMSVRNVTILGAHSSCTCTVVEDLPLELPAGQKRPLKIALRNLTKPGDFSETVELYTEYPGQSHLVIQLTGHVVGE